MMECGYCYVSFCEKRMRKILLDDKMIYISIECCAYVAIISVYNKSNIFILFF